MWSPNSPCQPGFRYTTMAGYDRNVLRYERALISDWHTSES